MQPTEETFERLNVWRRAQALSFEIYQLLNECREWGFKDQITRSAIGVVGNIAEGAERSGKGEFKQFLSYAKGSAGEARSQVLRAIALSYISSERGGILVAELREISRMIQGLIKSLENDRS